MTDPVASRPPANVPIQHARDSFVPADEGAPDTQDISFREMWADPDKGITFADVIDIINPLQHIPIVSTIYRMVTGDTISQGARMAGGILFGGVSGLLAAGVVMAVEEAGGDTVERQIAALFEDDEPAPGQAGKQVASVATETAATRNTETPPGPPASVDRAAATPLFTARQREGVTPIPATVAAKTVDAPPPPAVPAAKNAVPAMAAPTSAPEKADKPLEAGVDKMAADRQRITEGLARARTQQMALLLASLAPSSPEVREDRGGKEGNATRNIGALPARTAGTALSSDPFRSHPFMLPPGASPAMVSLAMEQALNRYHQGQRARSAAR